jgi:hypothetical protein
MILRRSEVERRQHNKSVDNITTVLGRGWSGWSMLQLLPWHSADKYLSHRAPILPESVGQVKQEPRRRGWVFSTWAPGSRRADVGDCLGPQHRLDGYAGECGRLDSYCRRGTRRRRAVPGARESEMGEDPLNDSRVLDRGDELHPPGAARTAQDV